jgi:uncharacterized membrane protein YbhN (UPF0104 family)
MTDTTASAMIPSREEEKRALDRTGSYLFSYLAAALLLGSLIYVSGVWNFLANTRLLDVMIRAGIVEYHDAQTGFIRGVPDLDYYLKSQDPIKWGLVELAGVLFLFFWIVRAVQFHSVAAFCGIKGNFTQHARAYLEGIGVNRLLPYNAGHTRLAAVYQRQGVALPQIAQAIFLNELTVLFAIVFYAIVGLLNVGWSMWLAQLFWPLVILGVSWYLVRTKRRGAERVVEAGFWRTASQSVRVLARHPMLLAKLAVLALVAFALLEAAAYLIAMAFTSDNVILAVTPSVLLMGLVGGYIARLIPITPGGVGQFEWGFAAALYAGGLGLPECAAIAILTDAFLYLAGTLLLLWVYILRVDYSFEVLKRVETKAPGT